MSAEIPAGMTLGDILKPSGFACPEETQDVTFEKATTPVKLYAWALNGPKDTMDALYGIFYTTTPTAPIGTEGIAIGPLSSGSGTLPTNKAVVREPTSTSGVKKYGDVLVKTATKNYSYSLRGRAPLFDTIFEGFEK